MWRENANDCLRKSRYGNYWVGYYNGQVVHVFRLITEHSDILIYDEERQLYGCITSNRIIFGEMTISKLNENINNKSEHKWFPEGYREVSPKVGKENDDSSDDEIIRVPIGH